MAFKIWRVLLPISFYFICSCATEEKVITEQDANFTYKVAPYQKLSEEFSFCVPSKSFANNSLSGKIVSNEKYNFELDTERVLYIQSGDYMSLTFPITRKYPNDLVENLFIHRFGDGFIAYLFHYNFNSDDLENLDHGLEIVDIESKIKFTELSEFDLDDIGLNAPSFERGGFTGHIVLHDGGLN